MRISTHLQAALLIATLGVPAYAQPPIQFVNSSEAVRRYEAGMLDGLRERCASTQALDLWDRAEHRAIANGFIYVQDKRPVPGQYVAMAYDQDAGKFTLIEGQALGRDVRLTLKMALPRDYARCRIIIGPTGTEYLEVATFERTYSTESLAFKKLLAEAQELAQRQVTLAVGLPDAPPQRCEPPKPGPSGAFSSKLIAQGAPVALSECQEATHALRARMVRVLRRVFEK